jgi:transcriptional regulator with XRE-family HTH domain
MSQEELALEASLDRSYMGQVERGEKNLGFTNLLKIATALGLKPSQLLSRAERSG